MSSREQRVISQRNTDRTIAARDYLIRSKNLRPLCGSEVLPRAFDSYASRYCFDHTGILFIGSRHYPAVKCPYQRQSDPQLVLISHRNFPQLNYTLKMSSLEPPFAPHRAFLAQMNVLSEALDFVAAACLRLGLRHDTALRAKLVIEELFTNSVLHGYRGGNGTIWLSAHSENNRMSITYQDEAPAYNPFDANAATAQLLHAKTDKRPAGGLGVFLVSNLADTAIYRYENGRNILELSFLDRLS